MSFPKIGCEWLFMVLFPPSWDLHCHALPVDACRVERIRWLNHQVQGLDLHSIRQSPLSRLTYIRILCFYWGEWIWMNLITCWLNDGNEETSWIWIPVNLKKGETPFAENVLARLRIVCAIMAPRLWECFLLKVRHFAIWLCSSQVFKRLHY